jgi:hypothetical protein
MSRGIKNTGSIFRLSYDHCQLSKRSQSAKALFLERRVPLASLLLSDIKALRQAIVALRYDMVNVVIVGDICVRLSNIFPTEYDGFPQQGGKKVGSGLSASKRNVDHCHRLHCCLHCQCCLHPRLHLLPIRMRFAAAVPTGRGFALCRPTTDCCRGCRSNASQGPVCLVLKHLSISPSSQVLPMSHYMIF